MRIDQRKSDELRPVTIERNIIRHAAGSVMVSFGGTRVLCAASYEAKVPGWLRGSGKGWVTAEYAMLPASTHTRSSRDASKKGRALEISRLIGRSLRAVTDLAAIGECQITLDCDVIQADGGTRTAAITGAYVALHDALGWAVAQGNIPAVPLRSHCAAVSVGIVGGKTLLDLNYEEDVSAAVDMNVVMNGEGRFIEVQATGEEQTYTREELDELVDLASRGIGELIGKQKEALGLD